MDHVRKAQQFDQNYYRPFKEKTVRFWGLFSVFPLCLEVEMDGVGGGA